MSYFCSMTSLWQLDGILSWDNQWWDFPNLRLMVNIQNCLWVSELRIWPGSQKVNVIRRPSWLKFLSLIDVNKKESLIFLVFTEEYKLTVRHQWVTIKTITKRNKDTKKKERNCTKNVTLEKKIRWNETKNWTLDEIYDENSNVIVTLYKTFGETVLNVTVPIYQKLSDKLCQNWAENSHTIT